MFKDKVLILAMSTYDFKNSDNELVKGTTVHYVALKNDGMNQNLLGLQPAKGTLPVEVFQQHRNESFPCYAEMEFTFDYAKNKIKPINFNFLKSLEVGELIERVGK